MLHSDLFPETGCDGELTELPELYRPFTIKRCAKCCTELLSWLADDGRWVSVVYPGMNRSMDRHT